MDVKQKVKDWYSKKPKHDIWFYVTIILLIHIYLIQSVVWLSLVQAGILAPEVDITPTAERISEDISANILNTTFRMFEVGQSLSDSPSRYIIQGLIGVMFPWGTWLIIFYLFHGVIRGLVVTIYQSIQKKKLKNNKGGE